MIKCKVRIGDQTVHYWVAGRGEPIILVHGLACSTLWWSKNVPVLAKYYRVYLIDLPGFGTMRRFYYRFTLDDAASWLLQWMEAVGIERAHFVGHSMGGYICLWFAVHKPEVVRRLVLGSPAAILRTRSLIGYFFPLLQVFRIAKPSFLPTLCYDALRAGPLTLLSAAKDLLTKDIQEELKFITTPTLLIWGVNDALIPLSVADILHKGIANSRLLILEKAGHVVMYDQAQEFNTALLAFLANEDVESQVRGNTAVLQKLTREHDGREASLPV